jgi:NhaP-type Na+/H+ or K+/H+ antiporter
MMVVFSIIVQGLTIGKLVRHSQNKENEHRTSNVER